jgi:hypothetical protein
MDFSAFEGVVVFLDSDGACSQMSQQKNTSSSVYKNMSKIYLNSNVQTNLDEPLETINTLNICSEQL